VHFYDEPTAEIVGTGIPLMNSSLQNNIYYRGGGNNAEIFLAEKFGNIGKFGRRGTSFVLGPI
jgi:hypothetical protein